MPLSNEELITLWNRFKDGDAGALGQLSQQHYGLLFNYGTKFSKDREFVKDCLQELFLDLWRNRKQLSQTPFVKAYLLTALRNRMLKELRRQQPFHPLDELGFEPDSTERTIESNIIAGEFLAEQTGQLSKAIQQLTKRQKEIIYLRFYQHLEFAEIAQLMNLSSRGVANLLYRSLKELKKTLLQVSLLVVLLVWSIRTFE